MRIITATLLFLLPYTTRASNNGGLRRRPCPGSSSNQVPPDDHPRTLQDDSNEGLLNEGKGCWGWCDSKPGDCPQYCGTGQCCRDADYRNGIEGCELAQGVIGAKCGSFKSDIVETLKNVGLACFGACDKQAGLCDYCGSEGSCCRPHDGTNCVAGCELASQNWIEGGPGSQCGDFAGSASDCDGSPPPPPPPSPTSPDNLPTTSPVVPNGLLNEGVSCGGPCGITDGEEPGDCSFCGTGQCCNENDWWRGKFGCELSENVTGTSICGLFDQPRPEPDDFRIGMPMGGHSTPESDLSDAVEGLWIKDIMVDGSDAIHHEVPYYNGEGGQPWSMFEMKVVRDLLLFEMRQASAGRDELSTAKFIRLPFHDCLHYTDGTGGCDGCLNWESVGFRFEGRVEERNYEDHERKPSNNGLGIAVEFLESIYQMDLGKSWGSGCYKKPASIVGNDIHLVSLFCSFILSLLHILQCCSKPHTIELGLLINLNTCQINRQTQEPSLSG